MQFKKDWLGLAAISLLTIGGVRAHTAGNIQFLAM